jgi:phage N-6-adenine-methyltransferase
MIQVNNEFKALIPDLLPDEYQQLEQNLLADGIRDPLVLWENVIIDGHNRYNIAKKYGLSYKTVSLEFNNENDVKFWILNNQLGRRNLTDYDRARIALKLKTIIAKKAKENQIVSGGAVPQKSAEPIETRKELAKIAGVSHDTINKVEHIESRAIPEIKEHIRAGNISINDAEKATRLEPGEQKAIADKISSGQIKYVNEALEKKPHVSQATGNNEWYTPPEYIEAARKVLGTIDLDPASNAEANGIIKAEKFFTAEDDGLNKNWKGKVWLNPPYASNLIAHFALKLRNHYAKNEVTEAIVLVNNATETAWFNTLINSASVVVFPKSRVKFHTPSGEAGAPLQGQAFIYLGKNSKKFMEVFKPFGWGAFPCGG